MAIATKRFNKQISGYKDAENSCGKARETLLMLGAIATSYSQRDILKTPTGGQLLLNLNLAAQFLVPAVTTPISIVNSRMACTSFVKKVGRSTLVPSCILIYSRLSPCPQRADASRQMAIALAIRRSP